MKAVLPRRARGEACRYVRAAWLGAMIEGEGSIGWVHLRSGKRRTQLSVTNTSLETIATVLRLAGFGHITYRAHRPGSLGKKPIWRWASAVAARNVELLSEIVPFLTSKQEPALRMMAEYMVGPVGVGTRQLVPRRVKVRMARMLSAYGYGQYQAPADRRWARWLQIGGRV